MSFVVLFQTQTYIRRRKGSQGRRERWREQIFDLMIVGESERESRLIEASHLDSSGWGWEYSHAAVVSSSISRPLAR